MSLLQLILESTIQGDLRQGLAALTSEDRQEIEPRFYDCESKINHLKSSMAGPGPQFNQQEIFWAECQIGPPSLISQK